MGIEERVQSREIDGVTYEVRPVPTAVGYKALIRLVKIAGPVLSKAVSGGGAADVSVAAQIIGTLASSLDEKDIEFFADLFGKHTTFSPEGDPSARIPLLPNQQEMHFAARYTAFFEWLRFCVEVNFGGFFDDLKKLAVK